MTDEWTAGIVATRGETGPPSVEEWRPVSVPGRPAGFDREGPVAYRTTFADPRTRETDRAVLELRGAYDRATVWLNGTELGSHEPHFVPARVEFEPRTENELVVVCEAPDSFAGVYGTDEVPDAVATPGIWWDVSVESRPPVFCRRLETRPTLDDDGAAIDVTLEVDAGEAIDDSITLSVRPEGFGGGATMERAPVQAAAGERTTVSKTVPVREPSLWWPRGYGPQRRYTVRAKLGDDATERTVGFRRVERDDDGLVVNGTRVRARGLTRLPGGEPTADVARAVEANATLVRARAHVPAPAFYDACDEAGLLVWQDLPATGPELEVDRGTELAGAIDRTYGHHPSLAMYGVQDRPADPFSSPLGSGILGRLAFRLRAWRTSVDREPAEAIADAVPGDLPVVPITGPPGTDPDAAALALGWRYLEAADVEWLLERYPSLRRVVGSVDVGSLASDERDPGIVPGLDPALLERAISDVDGLTDDADASQAYQARTLKTVVEALRRRNCGVLAGATLRDATPGGGMGVLTNDGEAKPAYRAIARSLEPVQAVLDDPPTPGTVGITLCNDTTDDLEPTVAWRAGDERGRTTVTVGPLETAAAGTATIPPDAERVDLEVAVDDRAIHNRYSL